MISLELFKDILIAWRDGDKKIRLALRVAATLGVLSGSVFAFKYFVAPGWEILDKISFGFLAAAAGLTLLIVAIQETKEEVKKEETTQAAVKRFQENPHDTLAAWDLARDKLERYLDRNLSQVRSIFWLTLIVMVGGFTLISIGAYQAFQAGTEFSASVLTTISGVIVSFIGGTFLILYKSTMTQAKEYVTILERINAVGMSVQILDKIDDSNSDLRHLTTAEVAKQLLCMYSANIAQTQSNTGDLLGGKTPVGKF